MSMSIQLPVFHCKHYYSEKKYRKSFHKGDACGVSQKMRVRASQKLGTKVRQTLPTITAKDAGRYTD